ncbi:haloacid dehalogenase [Aspergillus heteromorphus CBS 117.55]|uniref:Haloacid dehalogenase n=1 Tax=Aspergillus heteromorphus CBS 117.55 TaxID=1448321 RepID=A0A317VPI4_9EURO|nr:haloacid dehalogenase [Aspergillus heteromorphus CBS 117.55]PWY76273.1 haloacid dehalogenase [Aspergillus heteromorphus CBS 117.55]
MAVQPILAFDIYGTLLSFEVVTQQLEHYLDDSARARTVSQTWRRYQLEYTWRLNSMGRYQPFLDVTKNALVHALADTDARLSADEIEHLMATYNSLSPFPDVDDALTQLTNLPQTRAVIFSNGTQDMVSKCVDRTPSLSRHRNFFQAIISADEVGQYKPAPDVYKHLAARVGKHHSGMQEIWLVSGNPFDVAGALNVGMKTIWVARDQAPWTDRALPDLKPTATVHSLGQVVDVIRDRVSQYS